MSELRLYTFVNLYLSQIQQGIQSAHIVSELMANAYVKCNTISTDPLVQEIEYDKEDIMVLEWAEDHKTIIVCNGGNADSLIEMITIFAQEDNPYPWTRFHEDMRSLQGTLTAVGIVLPEEIYDAYYDKEADCYFYDPETPTGHCFYCPGSYEYELLKLIKSKRLA